MRHRVTVLLFCGLIGISFAGCGDNNSTGRTQHSPAAATGAHNADDVGFSQMMIPHHRQAVTMAGLAASRAESPAVKKLAKNIAAAQGPEITTMTGWLTAWREPLSMKGMSMAHDMPGIMSQADMATLKRLRGAEFDQKFLRMMIAHHQGAVTMAKHERKSGKNAPARSLAGSIMTSQARQIATMRRLLS